MPKSVIKNRKTIAVTVARRDALAVLETGLKAIGSREAIRRAVSRKGDVLTVQDRKYDLKRFKRIFLIGIGKAAADSAVELERILGSRITDGIVLDVKPARLKRVKSMVGTHPLPSGANTRATGEIVGLLKQVESGDLVVTVVSGGGSALLCMPYEMKCGQLAMITKAMMRKGATIAEMNTVRKHLSEIQGGQFARLAYPATVIGLILSDVVGDDLALVASGPTVMDLTTVADARKVMEKYDLLRTCRLPDCRLNETPKDPVYFRDVSNHLIMSNSVALEAMKAAAEKRGYPVRIYSRTLDGEAREVGRMLAGLPKPGEMVLSGGETTVTVRGEGKGGRNQELALGALATVGDDVLVLSCASDGIDNTPAAGAIADAVSAAKAERLKLDPKAYLAKNDSFTFWRRVGAQIMTGMTGANVSDLMIAMRRGVGNAAKGRR